MPKVNNQPRGEKSPNLVTLLPMDADSVIKNSALESDAAQGCQMVYFSDQKSQFG
jgi:hypothetical protein